MLDTAQLEVIDGRGTRCLEMLNEDPDALGRIRASLGHPARGTQLRVRARFARWHLDEHFEDPDEAVERLRELVALPDNLVPLPFSASARAIDGEPSSAMSQVFAALDRHGFAVSGGVIGKLRACGLWDRVMLLAPDDDGVLRIAFIGDGMAARFGRRQALAAIGKPYDHDFGRPDRYFSRSSTVYRQVLQRGEPCRHHVDSLIPDRHLPGTAARVQYDRIVVRTRLVNGAPALVIASQVRSRLLPLLPVGRPDPPATAGGRATGD